MASLTPEDRLRLAREMDETRLRMYRMKVLRERPGLGVREQQRALLEWMSTDGIQDFGAPGERPAGPESNGLERAYERLAVAFDALEAPWALGGSLAVSARIEPAYMTHASVILAVKEEDVAHAILDALEEAGLRTISVTDQMSVKDWDHEHGRPADPFNIEIEQHPNGLVAGARLVDDTGERDLDVDLIFAASGIEAEITAAAEPLEILPGQVFAVARTGHLIALTLLSFGEPGRQPLPGHFETMDAFSAEQAYSGIREHADLRALTNAAAEADWRLAWEAVDLMTSRSATRSRDLRAELAAFLAESED
ncbi:hypothetical protein [Glycomyces albidus]|uniref:Uncharacterized protein n=1 Tax=Glycomyces albidus TaxID=2656774 RepID=A0A6L5G6C0_9ACTN|nr:hypothetical protein [Glycomyces albidus]MQM25138.1 hypothetical protein [Glycomyces albidus]